MGNIQGGLRRACALGVPFLLPFSSSLAQTPPIGPDSGQEAPIYSLSVHLDPEAGGLFGTLSIPTPCARWSLPPNRFSAPMTLGGELMERRVYPRGFEPIALVLSMGGGADAPAPRPGAGGTEEPLEVTISPTSQVSFELSLGERQGGVGMVGGAYTLQGGFFPQPLCDGPVPQRYDVDLTWVGESGQVLLGGQLHTGDVRLGGVEVGEMLTLIASRELADLDLGVPGVTLYGSTLGRRQRQGLHALFSQAMVAWSRWGYALPPGGATLALAPMELSLTLEGGGVMLLSQRALNLNPQVMAAHGVPVSLGLFRHLLLKGVIDPGLPPARRYWVADAIAAHLALRLEMETRGEALDPESLIKPLAFLPGFDQLLYAPRMAFAQEVYGSPFTLDPLMEDLRQFRAPMPPGRVILLKLTDRFGPEVALAFIEAGLRGADPIAAAASAVPAPDTPEDLLTFVGAWEGPMPQEDLAVVREPSGAYHIERRALMSRGEQEPTRGLPEEVVLIQVVGKDGGESHPWVAPPQGHGEDPARSPTLALAPGERLTVDPIRHVLEATPEGYVLRGNNSVPRDWKVIVGGITRSLSFQQRRFDMSGGLSFMPRYDRRTLVTVDAYTNDLDLLGVSGGYFRYFGAPRDAVWRRHRAGIFGRGSLARSAFDPGVSTVLGVGVSYRYESRQDLFDPREGARLAFTLEGGRVDYGIETPLGQGLLGYVEPQGVTLAPTPDDPIRPYGRVNASAVVLRDPWAMGVIALRGVARAGLGDSRPDLYFLGGGSGVRGLPAESQGTLNALMGAEIRQGIAEGRPLDLGLIHLRKVDLVGFFDAGALGGGLQDRPLYGAGWGGGVRLHLLALGLQPGLFGLDVAQGLAWDSLDGTPTWAERPQVYLRFAQGF